MFWKFGGFGSYWGGGHWSPFGSFWDVFCWWGSHGPKWPEPDPNTAPVAVDDYLRTDKRTVKIDVLENDSDADGDRLTISEIDGHKVFGSRKVWIRDEDGHVAGWVKVKKSGELQVRKFKGVDELEFTYTVSDGKRGETDEATVRIVDEDATFRLSLLHFADQEAGARAVEDAPRFSAVLNALRDELDAVTSSPSRDPHGRPIPEERATDA